MIHDSLPMLPTMSPSAHVLVVDGDATVFRVLEGVLQRRGFTVAHEDSPRVALERLRSQEFDIVICDLNMAGISGEEFTRAVLAMRPDIPVLLMTGKQTMELAIHAVLTGSWDYLLKPVDATQLILSMDRASRHRQQGKELRSLRSQVENGTTPVSSPGA